MLNGVGKGLSISVLIHLVLILTLSQQFHKTPDTISVKKKETQKSIKSFLYSPVYKKPIDKVEVEVEVEAHTEEKLNPISTIKQSPKKEASKLLKKNITESKIKKNRVKNNSLPIENNEITASKLKEQLNKFRTSQDKSFYGHKISSSKSHIPSVFNPNPQTVSRSTSRTELEVEEDKKLQVTQYGDGIAIKKNKNGSCSVTQDLSSVGMPGLSSTQFFKCGKSEFDKNFSQHMKKAMAKYK